jgi:hypothetical protein
MEQWTKMKFRFKLSKTVQKPTICFSVFMGMRQWVEWFERFRGGADFDVSKIKEMVRANRRLTIGEISNVLTQCSSYWPRNVNMKQMSAKFVPRTERIPPVDIVGVAWSCEFRFGGFHEVWSLETNVWYMATILTRKCSVLTGKHRTRHKQRKRVKRNQMWKSCWSVCSILKLLFKLGSRLEAPLWTRNTTRKVVLQKNS